jgi:predicted DNA-binding protein with PD1-like motif
MAKIFVFKKGTSVTDEILAISTREGIKTARVEAIGGVDHLNVAYFNRGEKRYEDHRYDEFLEVTSILGNVTTKDGKPFLHIHGNFGRRDMSVIGGHIIAASVSPTLEVVITPTANAAVRRFDEESGLNLISETP